MLLNNTKSIFGLNKRITNTILKYNFQHHNILSPHVRQLNTTARNQALWNPPPKVGPAEIDGVKLYPPRTKAYRAYRAGRIIFKALAVGFGLSVGYVVVREYLEDMTFKKAAKRGAGGEDGFKLSPLEEGEEFPVVAWPTTEAHKDKPKLVVLGTGWGSIGLIKHLDLNSYDVATVGTIEPRSLLEPIRKILRRFAPSTAHYFHASAIDVDLSNNRVLVKYDDSEPFWVPYDHLVVAVGSKSITFGIKGLENASFLHSIEDAREIRKKLFDLLERASLPNITEEAKKNMLSFVVCGGGPTGVEFAAELEDLLVTDLRSYFPDIVDDVSIHIIQSREHILNTYDEQISKYTEERFKNRNINIITNARVKELTKDSVVYTIKNSEGQIVTLELPQSLVLWSTGIAMRPIVDKIRTKLEEQTRSRALTVDGTLRVKGLEDSSIFALGDCASVEIPKILNRMVAFFESADTDHDGKLDFNEFKQLASMMLKEVPRASAYIPQLLQAFKKYDRNHDGTLDLQEVEEMIKEIDQKMTSLPATAQVANQQGKYLAKLLNDLHKKVYATSSARENSTLRELVKNQVKEHVDKYPKFTYKHLGSLAYIGNSAVAELENPAGETLISKPKFILAGFSAMYLWRSIYWSEQVSARNRMLISWDWSKRLLFGRDLSRI